MYIFKKRKLCNIMRIDSMIVSRVRERMVEPVSKRNRRCWWSPWAGYSHRSLTSRAY